MRTARSVPKISEHREAKLATAKQKNVYIKASLGKLFGGKEEERRGVQQYKYLQKDFVEVSARRFCRSWQLIPISYMPPQCLNCKNTLVL